MGPERAIALPTAGHRGRFTLKYFPASNGGWTGAIADLNDNGWYVTSPSSVKGATIANLPPPGSGFTYDGWNGDTPWSDRIDRVNLLTAEFTRAFWEKINMRLAASLLFDNFDQDVGYLSAAAPSESWDPTTGQEVAVANNFNPASGAGNRQSHHERQSRRTGAKRLRREFQGGRRVAPARGRLDLPKKGRTR